MPAMPACDARYDVLFNDGSGLAPGGGPRFHAVVDMTEERLPDDWGDPGPLVSARLARWWSAYVGRMEYAPVRGRMALWIDGYPRLTRATRRYLRWAIPDADPEPHSDPTGSSRPERHHGRAPTLFRPGLIFTDTQLSCVEFPVISGFLPQNPDLSSNLPLNYHLRGHR